MPPVKRQISPHAARLRRDMTDAERRLWSRLRGRQLGGYKFRRQTTIGSFVVDFLCVDVPLIVEVDGGQHDQQVDARRTAALKAAGYRIVRYWNNEVLENLDGVLADLLRVLEQQEEETRPSPPASRVPPLPQAGEG